MSVYNVQGLGTMTWIGVRTGWKGLLGWTLGMIGIMAITASSITALYDTPEKLRGYADTITGGAVYMLNGKVAGLDTLGGVLANEFGFVLSFAIPIMAIALTGRATRRDESAGRLELLLASAIGRHAPILAAVVVATVTLLVTGLGCAVAMIAFGAASGPSLLYGIGMACFGVTFVGVTAIAAQLVEHNRTVWGIVLSVTVASYLLRGIGAVQDSALIWLSPHGWLDEARSFGDARAWPIALLLILGMVLVGVAFWLSTRRDVGSALIRPQGAKPAASAFLQSPLGVAWHDHRGSIIGWTIGAAVLMGTYGSLSQEIIDAIAANPALGDMIGADAAAMADQLLGTVTSTFLMMLAMVVAAFAIMAIGSLRNEEETGRLETQLSGARSRGSWLTMHTLVAAFGVLVVGAVGAVALAATTAFSTGDDSWFSEIMDAAVGYLPAALVFFAFTLALFGVLSRARGVAWGVFAAAAAIAYLGPGFDLPSWLIRSSPFQTAGADLVTEAPDVAGVTALLMLTVALAIIGFIGFRVRDIPRG